MLINHDFPLDLPPLTERQLQVLDCLCNHMTTKEIARVLDISPSMVDQHLRAISVKFGGLARREIARLHAGQCLRPILAAQTPRSSPEQPVPSMREGRRVPLRENFLAGFLTGLLCGVAIVLVTTLIVTLLLKTP